MSSRAHEKADGETWMQVAVMQSHSRGTDEDGTNLTDSSSGRDGRNGRNGRYGGD